MAAAPESSKAPSAAAGRSFEYERVTFPNAAGQRLAGLFGRADAAPSGARCVILCHGYAGDKEDMALPDLADVRSCA